MRLGSGLFVREWDSQPCSHTNACVPTFENEYSLFFQSIFQLILTFLPYLGVLSSKRNKQMAYLVFSDSLSITIQYLVGQVLIRRIL